MECNVRCRELEHLYENLQRFKIETSRGQTLLLDLRYPCLDRGHGICWPNSLWKIYEAEILETLDYPMKPSPKTNQKCFYYPRLTSPLFTVFKSMFCKRKKHFLQDKSFCFCVYLLFWNLNYGNSLQIFSLTKWKIYTELKCRIFIFTCARDKNLCSEKKSLN